ncbi:hypothetical protein CGRA01v4_04424 [Colletotrichum graminicola]|nr:hypothetical protein CGRA01v4_04424 [Colletotrichum graminicola]
MQIRPKAEREAMLSQWSTGGPIHHLSAKYCSAYAVGLIVPLRANGSRGVAGVSVGNTPMRLFEERKQQGEVVMELTPTLWICPYDDIGDDQL